MLLKKHGIGKTLQCLGHASLNKLCYMLIDIFLLGIAKEHAATFQKCIQLNRIKRHSLGYYGCSLHESELQLFLCLQRFLCCYSSDATCLMTSHTNFDDAFSLCYQGTHINNEKSMIAGKPQTCNNDEAHCNFRKAVFGFFELLKDTWLT